MAHCLDHVACTGLALGADHGSALADAAQGLAQVAAATDEGHLEVVLVDVVALVGGGEHFALVNIVDAYGFEDAGFHKVPYADLRHDGDGDGLHDALDHVGVAHAGHATVRADVGGHALKRHHGGSARVFGDACVLSRHDVHNHAALEHLGKALFGCKS